MLLTVRVLEDEAPERDRLLLPTDLLELLVENEREVGGEDDRVAGAVPELAGVVEGPDGSATMIIPLDPGVEVLGCIRLLPTFADSPLLITMPWLPAYPAGLVDT